MTCKLAHGNYLRTVLLFTLSISVEGAWKNLIGSWTDSGTSWTGSIPYDDAQWHFGPARLWTPPLNSRHYVITSRIQALNGGGCGHVFKYIPGSVTRQHIVTKAWGYYIWGSMRITSAGTEYSPNVAFSVTNGAWYNLKSEVKGTHVKIYVNGKLVKKIRMKGRGAYSKRKNYVGLWCHARQPIKGDSFQVKIKVVKCPALTVRPLVKTLPKNCVASRMKFNKKCSFICPRGYQIQGPSYKRCRANSQWSDSAKTVSCIVVKCQALTAMSLVKTSPNNCVASQIKFNTKCSFTCPRGYRLQGPSYKQCKANGQWTDSAKKVSCIVMNCLALKVNGLLKTSPNSCVASQMKLNTKCLFTCPRGYQLQGPSYKQCKANGQWSDSAKKVSCSDIDECSGSKNGSCSHKCVNTAGGYKCQCPDPELGLSSDNKTCHALGVYVLCTSQNMTITISKSLLRGMDREHLRLLATTCKATETSANFSLTTPLTGCNTTSRHTSTAIVYSNTVLEIPVAAKDVMTRVREIEIQFSCFYSKYGVVSSVGWKPSNRRLVFSDEGQGNFTLALNMFPDKRFVRPYMKGDFPVAVVLRKLLYFEVSVTSDDKQLSIRAQRCYATPTQNPANPLKYEFIKKGCPNDGTMKYHALPLVSAQLFSLEAFKFIADHPFVFVHCHVILCNASDPGSKCAKKCSQGGRGRREMGNHVGNFTLWPRAHST